ncbi:hypothetical protein AYK20_04380 [Thermoplasmatales archaeon SG8-52-1]|nr:MAG: hypothetical protein AYK20_04380 [Thermoplasmatales archaeon SG8-52-1]
MLAFIVTFILSMVTYLMLTTGSGTDVVILNKDFLSWSYIEIIIGIILSAIVGVVARNLFVKKSFRMANPVRWFTFIAYVVGPFFVGMAKANIDVAYRVITGKINPGIVKISPNLKTDLGNEEKNDLYIHWINVKDEALKKKPVDCKYICSNFEKWVRRVAE